MAFLGPPCGDTGWEEYTLKQCGFTALEPFQGRPGTCFIQVRWGLSSDVASTYSLVEYVHCLVVY